MSEFHRTISKLVGTLLVLILVQTSLSGQLRKSFDNEREWRLSYKVLDLEEEGQYELAARYMDSIFAMTSDPDEYLFNSAAKSFFETANAERLVKVLKLAKRKSHCGVWKEEYSELIKSVSIDSVRLDCEPEIIGDFTLSNILVSMFLQDQDCRGVVSQDTKDRLLMKGYSFNIDPLRCIEMGRRYIDSVHTETLKHLIDSLGFPSKAMVGGNGIKALEALIIHSRDSDFQKRFLPNFKHLYEQGIIDGQAYILLYDKIWRREHQKTYYGTQAYIAPDGMVRMFEIEDAANVNARRMSFGVMPLESYAKLINAVID